MKKYYEEMYQIRVFLLITKYAIYTKRKEYPNFSEIRIRAHDSDPKNIKYNDKK